MVTSVTDAARIKLTLYATLRAYVGGASALEVDIQPGQTVTDVLNKLKIPLDQTRIIFVNNRSAERTQTLHGGEQIGVFPAIGGG